MKYGRFEQQGRVFFGSVEGDTVNELEGSIIENPTIPDLKHGDVCEIIQKDIGVLRNPIVRAGA